MSKITNMFNNLKKQIGKIAKHNRQGAPGTKDRYYQGVQRFCKHISEEFGVQSFKNISDKHIESYVKKLQDQGAAPSYIKNELTSIRFFHDKCDNAKNFISENEKFNLEKRSFGGVDRTWSKKEFDGMVQKSRDLGQNRIADALVLARNSGLRIHEVMKIDHNSASKAVKTGTLTVKGKGGRVRDIPLRQESIEILSNRLEDTDRGHKLYIDEGEKTHLVIKQVQNFIVRHRNNFQEEGRQSNMTFHGLRHTYASEEYQKCLDGGLNEYEARKAVSELLGHERDDVTRIYLASKDKEIS